MTGSASDVLVAPAASGITALSAATVSGTLTMLASGGTVENDGSSRVSTVNSAADNAKFTGTGTMEMMTVSRGAGVTVAGSLSVGKITNNTANNVTYGTQTIPGTKDETPAPTASRPNNKLPAGSSGGSGGSGGSGSDGDTGGIPVEPDSPGKPALPVVDGETFKVRLDFDENKVEHYGLFEPVDFEAIEGNEVGLFENGPQSWKLSAVFLDERNSPASVSASYVWERADSGEPTKWTPVKANNGVLTISATDSGGLYRCIATSGGKTYGPITIKVSTDKSALAAAPLEDHSNAALSPLYKEGSYKLTPFVAVTSPDKENDNEPATMVYAALDVEDLKAHTNAAGDTGCWVGASVPLFKGGDTATLQWVNYTAFMAKAGELQGEVAKTLEEAGLLDENGSLKEGVSEQQAMAALMPFVGKLQDLQNGLAGELELSGNRILDNGKLATIYTEIEKDPYIFGVADKEKENTLYFIAIPGQEGHVDMAAWTVAVYMCGSDLESGGGAGSTDIMEMMLAGISEDVRVLVATGGSEVWFPETIRQIYDEYYSTAGSDIPEAKVYNAYKAAIEGHNMTGEINLFEVKDGALIHLKSLGDMNMAEPDTLVKVFQEASAYSPAEHYMIDLWDHGAGPNLGMGLDKNYPAAAGEYNLLTLPELKTALDTMTKGLGGKKLDLVGFDCCLMGSLEIACTLQPYADYMLASPEVESGNGWYYKWLGTVKANSTAEEIGKTIIDYMTIGTFQPTEDYPNGGEDLLDEIRGPGIAWTASSADTLSLYDLGNLSEIVDPFNALAGDMKGIIAEAGSDEAAKQLYSVIVHSAERAKSMQYPEQLDLYSFCDKLVQYLDDLHSEDGRAANQRAKANVLKDALDISKRLGKVSNAIVYRGVGADFEGCAGITFYYPVNAVKKKATSADNALNKHGYETFSPGADYTAFLRSTLDLTAAFTGSMPQPTPGGNGNYTATLTDQQNWTVQNVELAVTYQDGQAHYYPGSVALDWTKTGNGFTYEISEADVTTWWTLGLENESGSQPISAEVVQSKDGQVSLYVPALVGNDTGANVSMLRIIEKDGKITIDAVVPPKKGDIPSRSYIPEAGAFKFTPVIAGIAPDGSGGFTDDGYKAGTPVTVTIEKDGSANLEIKKEAFGANYTCYLLVTDLAGNRHWSAPIYPETQASDVS